MQNEIYHGNKIADHNVTQAKMEDSLVFLNKTLGVILQVVSAMSDMVTTMSDELVVVRAQNELLLSGREASHHSASAPQVVHVFDDANENIAQMNRKECIL